MQAHIGTYTHTYQRKHRLVIEEGLSGTGRVSEVGLGTAVSDHQLQSVIYGLQLQSSIHPLAQIQLEWVGWWLLTKQVVLYTVTTITSGI